MFLNSFFAFPAAAAQARTLKKQVFVWKVLQISDVGRFRAEPKKAMIVVENAAKKTTWKRIKKRTQKNKRKTSKMEPHMLPQSSQNAVKMLPGGGAPGAAPGVAL